VQMGHLGAGEGVADRVVGTQTNAVEEEEE
jgi:hypothetical protein